MFPTTQYYDRLALETDGLLVLENGYYILLENSTTAADTAFLGASIEIVPHENRRLLEDGSYRLLETEGFRLLEGHGALSSSSSLYAKVNIYPYSNLNASIDVKIKEFSNLNARIFIAAISDLSAMIFVTAKSDLGASACVTVYGTEDVGARINVTVNDAEDLGAKIFIATTSDLGAKVFIAAISDLRASACVNIGETSDLGVSIAVSIYDSEDLGAQIFVEATSDFGARIFIVAKSNFGASICVMLPDSEDLGSRMNVTIYDSEDLCAKIFVEATSDIGASTYIIVKDSKDLASSICVNIYDSTNLGAKIFVKGTSDIGAKIFVTAISNLGSSINVQGIVNSDLRAKISLIVFKDLIGRVNVVSYYYNGLLAKIFIKGIKNLGASVFIPSYRALNAKIRIITMLNAQVFVCPRSELNAKLTVSSTDQTLLGSLSVICYGGSSLEARIYTGRVLVYFPAKITVDSSLQEIGGSVTVIAYGHVSFPARMVVSAPPEQLLKASITVKRTGESSFGARITTSADEQYFKARVNVLVYKTSDFTGRIRVAYNPPSYPMPSGYVIPSGYPPLPSGWISEGIAVPGPDAQLVEEGEWQAETDILFIWTPPEDWGYGATAYGYFVAWNDNENHVVSEQDQFVPDNFITKSWYDSGSIWFHVRAKNSHGWFSPQRSYNVKINAIASSPASPFTVDGGTTGYVTSSSNPLFSWGNSVDPDQLDVLDYNLQILPSGGQPSDIGEIDLYNLPQASSGYTTTHKLVQRMSVGSYQWRVRANDQKQFGPYCEWQYFSIVSHKEELGARIRLVEYWINNFRASVYVINYRDFAARITIPRTVNLLARIRIVSISELGAIVNLLPGKTLMSKIYVTGSNSAGLGARLRVVHASDLGASLEIKPYHNLAGRITVGVENQHFMASLTVCRKAYDAGLMAKLRIVGLLKARVIVTRVGYFVLNARINVKRKLWDDNLSAKISIPIKSDIGAMIFIQAVKNLNASITTLCDRPGTVVVTADVPDGVWQENNIPVFSWSDPEDEFSTVVRYYVAWNESPLHEVTRGDQLVIGNSISKIIFDAGIRYFHIKAENAFGNLSLTTTHYTVKYNHVPTVVEPELLVEGEASPIIHTVAPTFSWGNASDADQLDTLSYNIQVSTSQTFQTISRNYEDIEQTSNSSRSSFEVPFSNRIPAKGLYYWRVRAYDTRQYGEWTEGSSFEIIPLTSDLMVRVKVPIRSMSNFKASLNIIGHYELNAKIYIFNGDNRRDLNARISVSYRRTSNIFASLTIPKTSHLGAKIYLAPCGNLNAKLRIVGVPGYGTLRARINKCNKAFVNLNARIKTGRLSTSTLSSKIAIPSRIYFKAKMVIYDLDHFGFIEEFSSNLKAKISISQSSNRYLYGRISTIADRPGSVVISANVPASTWQGLGNITFTWTFTTAHWSGIEGYYTELDRNPSTNASDAFQKTEDFTRSFNLDMIDGAGVYYFHVAAKADNTVFGPTSHYAVWYNHAPTNPVTPMMVNRINSLTASHVISRMSSALFEWGQSYDADDTDSITYVIQIKRTSKFGVDNYGVPGIMYEQGGIETYKHTMAGGTLVSGKYYWRVKAFDGHQYSASWGPVASFSINSPPSVPSNLIVYS